MKIGVVQLSQVYVYGPIFIYVEKFDHLPHLLPHLIILNKMQENYLPASPNKPGMRNKTNIRNMVPLLLQQSHSVRTRKTSSSREFTHTYMGLSPSRVSVLYIKGYFAFASCAIHLSKSLNFSLFFFLEREREFIIPGINLSSWAQNLI